MWHPILGTRISVLLFKDGRCKVVLKLIHRGEGMVWLCSDTEEKKWIDVKILKASESTKDCPEVRVHAAFSSMDSQHTNIGNSRVARAIYNPWMNGPSGSYLFIVMPLLGSALNNTAERCLYDETTLMRICFQPVQPTRFNHNNGICYGDFRPHNTCFTLEDIEDLKSDDIVRAFGMPKLICLSETHMLVRLNPISSISVKYG